MFDHPVCRSIALLVLSLFLCVVRPAYADDLGADIERLQHGWAQAYYQAPAKEKEDRFEALAADARSVTERYPARAEPPIWEAIILSSYAKFQGGLGALDKIKRARELLLSAEKLDARALDGSVYTSLGSLYAKAPGWPLAFGDRKKAQAYLEHALAINADGIDPNFFYGELMADQKQYGLARRHLQKALAAPPRPGRADADAGRRLEVQAALAALPPG